ncbi:hypothetical protein M2432_001121 [Mycobacterium sp. OTB74]|nr:hypothetical protein [Mycobacterium sp. OTB74]
MEAPPPPPVKLPIIKVPRLFKQAPAEDPSPAQAPALAPKPNSTCVIAILCPKH